jgi:hypothetical protein
MSPEEFFDRMGVPYRRDKGRIIVGSVNISNKNLRFLPDLREVVVTGDFCCNHNHLVTLEGCPREIGKGFDCTRNQLKSLVGGPRVVHTMYLCKGNQLTSLAGAPDEVEDFDCSRNKLRSLESGSHMKVKGVFSVSNNRLYAKDRLPSREDSLHGRS